MAMRLPASRLSRVDFPTFCRPTIATSGLARGAVSFLSVSGFTLGIGYFLILKSGQAIIRYR
jgi:hypothetical protein